MDVGGRAVLVVDVGGVVLMDGMREVLSSIATASRLSAHEVEETYRSSGLRDALWTGAISTPSFWKSLAEALNTEFDEPTQLDDAMVRACRPLPTVELLNNATVEVWLASNHRAEWLRPALARSDLRISADRVVCSSEIGECKPSYAFFQIVADTAGIDSASTVHYVDDKKPNLVVPAEWGWATTLINGDPRVGIEAAIRAAAPSASEAPQRTR